MKRRSVAEFVPPGRLNISAGQQQVRSCTQVFATGVSVALKSEVVTVGRPINTKAAPAPGTLLTLVYGLYSVWLVRRYNSTRAGALGLFTVFLCGFIVLTIIGTYFRGPNWEFFWSPADWPKH